MSDTARRRAELDLEVFARIGEGDWTPQDIVGLRNTEALLAALDRVDALEALLEGLRNAEQMNLAERDVLRARVEVLTGQDWVPTSNLDATLEEMRRRGLEMWVVSLETFFSSLGAAYSAQAYHEERTRADDSEARLEALTEAAQGICDYFDSGKGILDRDSSRVKQLRAALAAAGVTAAGGVST